MARPAVKKQDIEDAAIKLFATKGLVSTTIKDIAQEAGVTDGALYRHYKSKTSMAFILFRRELELFSAQLRALMFEESVLTATRLENSVRFIFSYYQREKTTFAFIMLAQHGFPEEDNIPAELNPNDLALRFVREAMDAGDVPRADPVLMSGLALGMILQPLVMERYNRLELAPDTVDHVIAATKRVLQLA